MAVASLSSGRIRFDPESIISSISFVASEELDLIMAGKKKRLVKFRCNLCGDVVQRDAKRTWIKSYCLFFGKDSRLYRIPGKGK